MNFDRLASSSLSDGLPLAPQRVVTEDYTARVIALPQPRERNLLITQAYHDLSLDMADALGTPDQINWCTVAAWASRRAGQTIRGEDLRSQALIMRLLTQLFSRLPGGGLLTRLLHHISHQVAEGNREVFAEVAPPFAAFVAEFAMDEEPCAERFARFCRRFRPGSVAATPGGSGQDELRRAFELYYAAKFETCRKRKAEQIHAANLHVALQEQTRLQRRIAASMPLGLGPIITRALLSLELGGVTTYRLNADLPELPPRAALYHIEEPELRAFILRFDRDIDSMRGSGAQRWDDLIERMRYIVDLFRLHAHDTSLFEEPLSATEWGGLTSTRRPRLRMKIHFSAAAEAGAG